MTLFVLLIGIFKKLKEKKPKVQLPKQVQQLFSKVQHKQAGLQLVLRPNSDILANISEFKCGTLNVPCQAAKPPEYLRSKSRSKGFSEGRDQTLNELLTV